MFNLIEEKWIPVICQSGRIRKIAPWEISDETDKPLKVAFPRPDMNSAVTQFLIGLVQTSFRFEDDDAWLDAVETKIPTDRMKAEMTKIASCFELYGDDHPFMQENGISDPKNLKNISSIILTTPGGNTTKLNKDFFIKRPSSVGCMCRSCAAASVYTLQALAPEGGRGYMRSIRGSSPLTTIVEGNDLYTTVMLNILADEQAQFSDVRKVFPWMADHTSTYLPSDYDWHMVYWTTVRRVKLNSMKKGTCCVCGEVSEGFTDFFEVNKGPLFPSWEHPLCPYYRKKDDLIPAPVKDDITHLDQWTYMIYEGVTDTSPAKTVRHVQTNRHEIQDVLGHSDFRLWISGYQNKQALPISWKEMHQPILLDYSDDEKPIVSDTIRKTVAIVKAGESDLSFAFNRLLGRRVSDNSENKSGLPRKIPTPPSAIEEYWAQCDHMFRNHYAEINAADEEAYLNKRIEDVRTIALYIVDDYSEALPLDHYSNVIDARAIIIKRISVKSMTKRISNE